MGYAVKWDVARRPYILLTGRFKGVWAVKYIADKVEEVIRSSEACAACKCDFPIDAMNRDIFFWYIIIDGENKQDIEVCDSHVFGEIFKELERQGTRHRVGRLSYSPSSLKVVGVSEEGI